ncbi:hypothetical protein O181_042678 [Austropuccinia psidii MF-1]|uniref:Uncharacterized protein n=1 Tax=Austropuccinia psidii MF-1 TaxID=1389203 RepID=A0A9Q3DLK5_9BASI|nr:hypothetical protein [Austropuccinia psidii MF-1]
MLRDLCTHICGLAKQRDLFIQVLQKTHDPNSLPISIPITRWNYLLCQFQRAQCFELSITFYKNTPEGEKYHLAEEIWVAIELIEPSLDLFEKACAIFQSKSPTKHLVLPYYKVILNCLTHYDRCNTTLLSTYLLSPNSWASLFGEDYFWCWRRALHPRRVRRRRGGRQSINSFTQPARWSHHCFHRNPLGKSSPKLIMASCCRSSATFFLSSTTANQLWMQSGPNAVFFSHSHHRFTSRYAKVDQNMPRSSPKHEPISISSALKERYITPFKVIYKKIRGKEASSTIDQSSSRLAPAQTQIQYPQGTHVSENLSQPSLKPLPATIREAWAVGLQGQHPGQFSRLRDKAASPIPHISLASPQPPSEHILTSAHSPSHESLSQEPVSPPQPRTTPRKSLLQAYLVLPALLDQSNQPVLNA